MAVRVSTSADRGVARGGDQIRVVVVTVGEVRTLLEEEIPPVLRLELRAITSR